MYDECNAVCPNVVIKYDMIFIRYEIKMGMLLVNYLALCRKVGWVTVNN